jgi:hypothetical protein
MSANDPKRILQLSPTIHNDRTGYGMRDGKLHFIEDVPRGLACNCVCVRCGQPLVARQGLIRQPHFAHWGVTSCNGAAESVLHLLAKELIAELNVIQVPRYAFDRQRRTKAGRLVQHHALVANGGEVRIDSVRIEESEGDFIPDITIESGPKSLIIEVAVTHRVSRAKLRRIRRRNVPAIEIRLDPSDSLLPREALKNKLQRDVASKVWLFHPKQRKAEGTFISQVREALAHDRIPLHRSTSPGHAVGPFAFSPRWDKYDRPQEEFNRKHGRYPTLEECIKLWPHLWKKCEP